MKEQRLTMAEVQCIRFGYRLLFFIRMNIEICQINIGLLNFKTALVTVKAIIPHNVDSL